MTSIKNPKIKPAIAPTAGPFKIAQVTKTTITKSGVAPGNENFVKNAGCKTAAIKQLTNNAIYLSIVIDYQLGFALGDGDGVIEFEGVGNTGIGGNKESLGSILGFSTTTLTKSSVERFTNGLT